MQKPSLTQACTWLLSSSLPVSYPDILAIRELAGKREAKERSEGWRSTFPSGADLVLGSSGRSKLHQVAGDSGGIVASNVALIEIIAKNRNHAESFDGVEIGNDLACALER